MKSFALAACIVGVLFVGCGGNVIKTEAVTGTVTLDGQPLQGALVRFSPKTSGVGTPGSAITDAQGKYVLQTPLGAANAGTSAGEYVVMLNKTITKPTGKKTKDSYGDEQEVTELENILPATYDAPAKTPFSATVEKGKSNVFDFDLKSK